MPTDPIAENYCRQVPKAMTSAVTPTPVSAPRMLIHSGEVGELLGIDAQVNSDAFVQAMSGNQLLEGMISYSHCYGGHQFGHWAGQLGDGRAIALGEIEHKGKHWELQLKGAGVTPYSRMGDGRAVLRSSVREFLCSEAMYHLGIPTTRALSLVLTGDTVVRDMFYDGNPEDEPGAIVCRVAESFLRIGSLEIFSAYNDVDNLRRVVDFVLTHYYPHIPFTGDSDRKDAVAQFFVELCERTARMIAQWMSVGFVHGVMNTDNMSLLGLTIDYGPYGWLDIVDSGWTPNTSDNGSRRYAFGNQPNIGAWNMMKLAEALYPLVNEVEPLQAGLDRYRQGFQQHYTELRYQKLGFTLNKNEEKNQCINRLYDLMEHTETDLTVLFRSLSHLTCSSILTAESDELKTSVIRDAFYQYASWNTEMHQRWAAWLTEYAQILHADGLDESNRQTQMLAVNPKFIIRNYLAQMAIDGVNAGDDSMLHDLLRVLQYPYDEHPEHEEWAGRMPDWARDRAGCSALSCSS
jgi:uncharacterized protein YdiU (UPF0061 family)